MISPQKPSETSFVNQKTLLDILFICIFSLIISMGLLLPIFGVKDLPGFENRRLAELPSRSTLRQFVSLPKAINNYINDHFVLRNRLIHFLYSIRINVLNETVFPSVILGSNSWLYYTDENNMEDFQHISKFSENQLARISKNLDTIFTQLNEKNVLFVIAIAPNKETIYPENVPSYIPRSGRESRLDQLMGYLKENGKSEIIDLRPTLNSERESHQVYYRTDTHWNSIGAYFAYFEIMKQIQTRYPELKPRLLQEFEIKPIPWSGDLTNFLTMRNILIEQTYKLVPKFKTRTNIIAQNSPNSFEATREISDPSLPRAVIVHDSFGQLLVPYLAEHFQRLTNRFAPYSLQPIPLINPHLITDERPNIVILVIAERYLQFLLW